MATRKERLTKLGRRLGSALKPAPITIIEAPRTNRERRLDPATEISAFTGKQFRPPGGGFGLPIQLTEADPSTIDPNTSRLFSRREIRAALGQPSPSGARLLHGKHPAVRLLKGRIAQLGLGGGTIGQLVSESEYGHPIFGGTPRNVIRRTSSREITTPRFPYREQFPTQGSIIAGRDRRALSTTRNL